MSALRGLPSWWPWSLSVCPRCRGWVSPLAAPGHFAVHHTPGCRWQCRTVMVVRVYSSQDRMIYFREPHLALVPDEPLCRCRWCDRRTIRAIRQAAARRDLETVRRLAGAL